LVQNKDYQKKKKKNIKASLCQLWKFNTTGNFTCKSRTVKGGERERKKNVKLEVLIGKRMLVLERD
jgi:hypothetical protein